MKKSRNKRSMRYFSSFLLPPLGKKFSKKETFGAFPLQVQDYGDLHDSLEGAMAQEEIEPVGPEGLHKSRQEVRSTERAVGWWTGNILAGTAMRCAFDR